jgi:hypothetical protein
MEYQKLLALLTALVIHTIVCAQAVEISKVYGQVEVYNPKTKKWSALTSPSTLRGGELKIGSSSAVIYSVEGTNKPVSLRKAGTYTIGSLQAHSLQDDGSFAKAIGSQLTGSIAPARNSKASISRGTDATYWPSDSAYARIQDTLLFTCQPLAPKKHRFRVIDEHNTTLIDTLAYNTTFPFTFNIPGTYTWRIDLIGKEADINLHIIQVETNEQFDSRKQEYDLFLQSLEGMPSEWKEEFQQVYFETHPFLALPGQ